MNNEGNNEVTLGKRDHAAVAIALTMGADCLGEFFPILQQGFSMMSSVPCSVKNLLCDQFGLNPDYVSERITTIFLDGKATDNIDEALVRDRATIALSAAMPGLVGATMRRGSFYAAMRSAITLKEQGKAGAYGKGLVRVKLFNLLLTELGPEFLRRGVLLSSAETVDFFKERRERFWTGCESALLNGAPVEPERLNEEALSGKETVRLSVTYSKEDGM